MQNGNAKVEPRLVEVTSLPVFYCDNVGRVVIEGFNARLTYFEYRIIRNVRFRVPVVDIVRPLASCRPGGLQALLKAALTGDVLGKAH